MSKNNNLNFFEKLAILDSLISKGPVLESVGKLKNLLSEKSLYKYFFEKINDPSWIKLLKNMGYFSNPPKILKDNKGYITFPEWPESQYLARVAPKAPNLVCETILEIPETDNVRIHEDFIDAALNMPPVYSAKIAERESEWIKTQHHLYLLFPEIVTQPTAFTLVGMAAFFAAAAKVPVASVIMVSEMTGGYSLLVPLMLASAISYTLSGESTIYENQLERREFTP